MPKHYRVALMIESSRAYGRLLLRGIAAFGRENPNWSFFQEERLLSDQVPARLKRWRPDGILARLASAKLIRQLRRMNVPIVDLFNEDPIDSMPGVAIDQDALVEMAASHFLERRFRNFGYCGFAKARFSELREKRFVERIAAEGHEVSVFRYPPLPGKPTGLADLESHALRYVDLLKRWLAELPKPAAILACNDARAQQILDACAESAIAVPDDVAVLGVDNDDVLCELSRPPLSSIDPNIQLIGYEAATLLQKLFDGRRMSPERVLVQASRVVTRRSTDVLAIADRPIAEAARFVREHACDDMPLKTILSRLQISRSTLERWFQQSLGHSITAEILRVRVQRAAELLVTTSLKVETIAHRCGFKHVETMSRIFRRIQGIPPGQFREKFAGAARKHELGTIEPDT
jgi:LacI family transcriptional regulator